MLGNASDGNGGMGIGIDREGSERLNGNPSDGRAGSAGSAKAGIGGIGIGIESVGRLRESGNPRDGTCGSEGSARDGRGGIGMGIASAGRAGRLHMGHAAFAPKRWRQRVAS